MTDLELYDHLMHLADAFFGPDDILRFEELIHRKDQMLLTCNQALNHTLSENNHLRGEIAELKEELNRA